MEYWVMSANPLPRIAAVSDLHLDVGPNTVRWKPDALPSAWDHADVLVLAGDINEVDKGVKWARDVLLPRYGKPIVYVPGNHEGWGTSWQRALRKMKEAAAGHPIHVLDRESVVLAGMRFLGATLWTDFRAWPDVDEAIRESWPNNPYAPGMRDYLRIRMEPGFRRLNPKDTIGMAIRARAWLLEAAAQPFDGPTVVVTHHPPVVEAAGPHYASPDGALTHPLSAAYVNDWADGVAKIAPALWVSGHTHHPYRRVSGQTLLASHAAGHTVEELAVAWDELFEIPPQGPARVWSPPEHGAVVEASTALPVSRPPHP